MAGAAALKNVPTFDSGEAESSGPADPVVALKRQRWGASVVVDVVTRHRQALMILAALLVLGFIGTAVFRVGHALRPEAVLAGLYATPLRALAIAVLFTAISFVSLVFYDLAALRYIGRTLPLALVARTAFCAYAVGNTAGFGALSGGAIRFRAYSRAGLAPDDIAKVVAFVALAFGLGITAVTAGALLVAPHSFAASLGLDMAWLKAAAAAVLIGLGALFLGPIAHLPRLGRIAAHRPDRGTILRQLLVTGIDLAASAAVLYVLLPETGIGPFAFLGIYVVATGAGVLSHIPAGLCVFETIVIAALGPNVDLDAALGALVLYRLIYHVVPLALALALLAWSELARLFDKAHALQIVGSRDGLTATLSAALTLVVGLVTLAAVPGLGPSPGHVPPAAAEAARILPALLGATMLLAVRGLAQRLDGAWTIAAGSVATALIVSIIGGLPVEAGLQAVLLLTLWSGRRAFRQPALLFRPFGKAWTAAMTTASLGLVVIILIARSASADASQPWWVFWLTGEAPDALQFLLGLTSLVTAFAAMMLLRPATEALETPTAATLESALKIVEAQGLATANLVRMGDKSVLFSEDGEAFIMYAKRGRSWIALFDPVGPKEAWTGLIWRFIDAARAAGCRAVFYQVSPALLQHSADAGLRAFKLGEQASVDLTRFDLKGGKWASLRRSVNRAARDGLAFTVVEPTDVPGLIDELKAVSDAWLSHHNVREKGFSIGVFDPDYLASQRLAVLRLEGRIVAFASLLATGTRHDAFIDLMRFVPGVHRGGMDLLFVEIIEHLKREGFATLNLGMAPLAGMSARTTAPLWNKIGRAVFECGERLYNFKGLLAFKSKFDPDWQPRYLVVAGGITPYLAVMDVAILIGGGVRGVFRK